MYQLYEEQTKQQGDLSGDSRMTLSSGLRHLKNDSMSLEGILLRVKAGLTYF